MDTLSEYASLLIIGSFLISLFSRLLSFFWPKQLFPDPAALELIRKMTEVDQRNWQRMVTEKGKVEAVKELRATAGVGLKVSKDAIDLLEAVEPALLKFD